MACFNKKRLFLTWKYLFIFIFFPFLGWKCFPPPPIFQTGGGACLRSVNNVLLTVFRTIGLDTIAKKQEFEINLQYLASKFTNQSGCFLQDARRKYPNLATRKGQEISEIFVAKCANSIAVQFSETRPGLWTRSQSFFARTRERSSKGIKWH